MAPSPLARPARPRRPRRAAAAAALLGGAACGPALTPLGARVVVVPTAPPASCQVVGEVDGAGGTRARAEVALRNAAGEMHANRVVVGEAVDNGGHVHLHGQAFGCRTAPP